MKTRHEEMETTWHTRLTGAAPPSSRPPFFTSPRGLLALAILAALGAALALLLTSCATGPAHPPTALERKFFDIATNYTPQVHVITQVTTQVVERVVERTNFVTLPSPEGFPAVPRFQVVRLTNTKTVYATNTITLTNQTPNYTLTPNALSKDVASGAGAAGGLFGPYGGLIAGALGGIFGLWGHLRSSKSNATASVLAQVIETGSELLKTTPQGQALADKWKTWMIQHQAEEGVIEQVQGIIASGVDNESARNAAQKLAALEGEVKGSVI